MSKLTCWLAISINLVSLSVLAAGPAHKGISFQGVIKLPNGDYPSVAGVTVRGLVLSPNNCILREEEFSSVNIVKGYINLVIGSGVPDGDDPGFTMAELMDNSKVRSGIKCIDAGGVRVNGSYAPASGSGVRKFRIDLAVNGVPVLADFNMRAMAYAVNSETLNGKVENDFLQVDAAKGVTQTNLEKFLLQTTKLENLLSHVNADGTVNAASAVTAVTAQGLDSSYIVPVTQGGTGATTSMAALQNLLPIQAGKANHYLQTDGTNASWQPVASSGGTITEVTAGAGLTGGATTGTATLSLEELNTQSTYTKVTTDKYGRVTTGTTLADSDIPALPATKITSGTLGVDVQATSVSATNLAGSNVKIWNGTNYLTFTYPAGGAGYGLEWPAMTDAANANMVLQTDGAGKLQWVALPSSSAPAGAAAGDLADNYPNPRVAKIQGQPVDASAPAAGHAMVWVAGKWTPSFVKMSDVKNNIGGSMMPAANCAANQAMVWNVLTDSFVCQLIDDDTKLALAGGTMSGDINMGTRNITNAASASVGVVATNTVTFTSTTPASPTDGSLWYDSGVLKYKNASGTQVLGVADNYITTLTGDVSSSGFTAGSVTTVVNNVAVDKVSSAAGKYFTYQPDNIACGNNQVLKWINNRWECANDDNTPSAYAAGTGLDLTGTTFSVKYGTGAGEAAQGNDSRITGAFQASTALGQDLSGTLPNPKVVKINEVPVAKALATDDEKFLKYVDGTGWVPQNVKLSELKDSSGIGSAFNVVGCTDSQTMGWSSITDKFECQDIKMSLGGTGVTGTLPVSKGGTGLSAAGTAHQLLGMNAAGSALEYKSIPTCGANQYITFNGTSYSCVNDAGASGTVASITSNTTALRLSSSTGTITAEIDDATTAAKGLVQLAAGGGTTAGTVVQANDTRLSDSRAPSGAAGGDLTGTYPNPTLKATGTAGTYYKVTTDAQGRVTSGAALVATDITTALGYTPVNQAGDTVTGNLTFNNTKGTAYKGTTANTATLTGPNAAIGTSYVLRLPATQGAANQVMSVDGSGNLGWTTLGSLAMSSTVNNSNWSGAALSIANGGTGATTQAGAANAVLPSQGSHLGKYLTTNGTNVSWAAVPTVTYGTTAGTALQGNQTFAGDVTGTVGAMKVEKLQNRSVAATAPTNGQVLKWNNGSSTWEPSADADTNTTYTAGTGLSLAGTVFSVGTVPLANGGTGATTDVGARSNLGIGSAGTKNTGSISGTVPLIGGTGITNNSMCTSDGSSNLVCNTPIPTGSQWTTSGSSINYSLGNVGIGVAAPGVKLAVAGTVATVTNAVASGASVDLAASNIHRLASVGGSAITLSNMTNGGVYTIVVADSTSRTYTFSGCGATYFKPANEATTAGARTIYGITTIYSGTTWECYVTWASGFSN